MSILEHNGIKGSVEFDIEEQIFYGKLLNVNGVVMYDAKDSEEFYTNFKNAVEEYIEDCKENNIPIKKEFKGSFNVRTSPEIHEALYMTAVKEKTSLNAVAKDAFERYLDDINIENTIRSAVKLSDIDLNDKYQGIIRSSYMPAIRSFIPKQLYDSFNTPLPVVNKGRKPQKS